MRITILEFMNVVIISPLFPLYLSVLSRASTVLQCVVKLVNNLLSALCGGVNTFTRFNMSICSPLNTKCRCQRNYPFSVEDIDHRCTDVSGEGSSPRLDM